jgi:hypothetical protein
MVGLIQQEIIGIEDVGIGRTYAIQVKGAPGGSVRSGDRAAVSILVILETTSSGVVMRRPVVSSRTTERYVGRSICCPFHYAQNRFDRHTRFLNKQAEQSLVISNAAKVASMLDEESYHSP